MGLFALLSLCFLLLGLRMAVTGRAVRMDTQVLLVCSVSIAGVALLLSGALGAMAFPVDLLLLALLLSPWFLVKAGLPTVFFLGVESESLAAQVRTLLDASAPDWTEGLGHAAIPGWKGRLLVERYGRQVSGHLGRMRRESGLPPDQRWYCPSWA